MQISASSPTPHSNNNVVSLPSQYHSRSKVIIRVALAALSIVAGALATLVGMLPGVVVATGVFGSVLMGSVVGSLIFAVAMRHLMPKEIQPPQVVLKHVYVPQRVEVEVLVEKTELPKSEIALSPRPATPPPATLPPATEQELVTTEFYRLAREQCKLDMQHSEGLKLKALKKDLDLKVRTSTWTKEIKEGFIFKRWEKIFKNFDLGQLYLNACQKSVNDKIVQSDDKMLTEAEMQKKIETLLTLRAKWLNKLREIENIKANLAHLGNDSILANSLKEAEQKAAEYEKKINEKGFIAKAKKRHDFCTSKLSAISEDENVKRKK